MKKKKILNDVASNIFENQNKHSSFTIYPFIFTILKLSKQCRLLPYQTT